MCNESVFTSNRGVRSLAAMIVTVAASVLVASTASAQIIKEPIPLPTPIPVPTTACGPEVKEEVVKLFEGYDDLDDNAKASLEASVYEKYSYCGVADAQLTS